MYFVWTGDEVGILWLASVYLPSFITQWGYRRVLGLTNWNSNKIITQQLLRSFPFSSLHAMDPDANEPNFDPEANDHRKSSDHAEDDKSHPHTGDGASPGYFTFFLNIFLMP